MRLRQSLKPSSDAGGDVRLIGRPPANETIIAFEDRSEAPLRPPQRGQTFGQARSGHGPSNFVKAAPAPNRAAVRCETRSHKITPATNNQDAIGPSHSAEGQQPKPSTLVG